jgi:hypothetical protein
VSPTPSCNDGVNSAYNIIKLKKFGNTIYGQKNGGSRYYWTNGDKVIVAVFEDVERDEILQAYLTKYPSNI